jgi:hypothetical protein
MSMGLASALLASLLSATTAPASAVTMMKYDPAATPAGMTSAVVADV